MLADENDMICSGAARALGAIGPAAADAIPALEESFPQAPNAVGKSLGRIGRAAAPVLLKALTHKDDSVRLYAGLALQYIGPDAADWVSELAAVLEHEDRDVRSRAALVLAEIGPAATPAVPALRAAIYPARYWK